MTLHASGTEKQIIRVLDAAQQPVPNTVVILPGVQKVAGQTQQAVIDQVNEQFSPQLLIVNTGSEVSFPNSDKTRHHVYSFSPAKVFELPLYASSEVERVTFDTPGLVHLGCNIHDHMSATLIVSDQQIFAISDGKGEVHFSGIDISRFTEALVWHKQIGQDKLLTYPLRIADDSQQDIIEIELAFSYVAEQEKPRKLTLKEKLEKYKNK